jgi:hypothetical protein
MLSQKATPASVLAILLAAQVSTAAADPKIGSAEQARNEVEGVIGQHSQNISTGSVVFSNEVVRTGTTGAANLVFLDNTNLSIGPTSEVRLDKFVYNPGGAAGSVILSATKGAFRFVTGSQDKSAYQVRTPFGTLGVRGTIVEMLIERGITIRLDYGSAFFTLTNGHRIELSQSEVLHVDENGHFTVSTQFASILQQTAMLEPTSPLPPAPEFEFGAGPALALAGLAGAAGVIVYEETRPASP